MKCFILFILSVLFFTSLTKAETNPDPLRVTLQPSVISLDPGGVQDSQSWLVSRQINCQLVQNFGPNYILDAAESIKYITPLKIRLKLNPKAKFHDNTPVTSQDVIASLDYIKESRNILSNLFIWIEKIEIIDDKTILFSLKKQIPQFLNVLSSTNFKIFKKDFILQAKKDKNLWKKPLGCGKYKVSEFTDQYIKLIPVHQGLPIIFYLKK
jgi:ABC-type transport system substrate-binding protein